MGAHDDHESLGATLCLFTVEQSEIFWKAFVIGAVKLYLPILKVQLLFSAKYIKVKVKH